MWGVAQEWGLTPEQWDKQTHENKLMMAAYTQAMGVIKSMVEHDEAKKRESERNTKRKK